MAGYDLLGCLDGIDPAMCSYQEWVEVGMALHAEGFDPEDWAAWSARDGARYHAGECERKWATFDASGGGVAGGTIVEMARRAGWEPPAEEWQDWDAVEMVPVDVGFVEPQAEPPAEEWHPGEQLAAYVRALFEPGERVGVVCGSYEDEDGKRKPVGCVSMERDYLLGEVARYGDDLSKSVGSYDPEAGAWVCFNPLDGQGRGNGNVTAYRYALVESDEVPKDRQRGMVEALGLPVAALVDSGGKSVHAIVRVDAPDLAEYRRRVNFLYEYCAKKGYAVDTQNKNPSRLSRLPGAVRGEGRQWLLAADGHPKPWGEWVAEVSDEADGMPDSESLADLFADMPEKAPQLIEGVLRQGHKMMIAGPSKAGKSYALIELCAAMASGTTWFGKRVRQGAVLYINLEIDRASCAGRFKDVFGAMGVSGNYAGCVEVWNLRGMTSTLDKLAPRIVRRAKAMASAPAAIIIDPIYKVMTGDENSASEMGAFCNHFDRIARDTGAAVIYCHHQSKGAQGGKNAMDRASGSGVFARDADAIVDVSELVVPDGEDGPAGSEPAFEVTWITREFKAPPVQKMWFRHPVHVVDEDGALKGAGVAGSAQLAKAEREKAKKEQKRERKREEKELKAKANSAILHAITGPLADAEIVKREDLLPYVAEALGDAIDDINYESLYTLKNNLGGFRYMRIYANEFGVVSRENPQAAFFADGDEELYRTCVRVVV